MLRVLVEHFSELVHHPVLVSVALVFARLPENYILILFLTIVVLLSLASSVLRLGLLEYGHELWSLVELEFF